MKKLLFITSLFISDCLYAQSKDIIPLDMLAVDSVIKSVKIKQSILKLKEEKEKITKNNNCQEYIYLMEPETYKIDTILVLKCFYIDEKKKI